MGRDTTQYWAILSPSAHHSVAYLNSSLATAAAADLKCGQYHMVVELPGDGRTQAVAYFVQSAHLPLPATYIPILPCRLGTREPLVPNFEWPFGECIVDTTQKLIFTPVLLESNTVAPRVMPEHASRVFAEVSDADDRAQSERELVEWRLTRKADQEAAGLVDDDPRWTTFSPKSTVADAQPGQFFPPSSISAEIRYDIESLRELPPASQCLHEVEDVKRLRARFTRLGTERTITWVAHQNAADTLKSSCERDISNFELTGLLAFSTTFERAPSADQDDSSDSGDDPLPEDDFDDWGGDWTQGITSYELPLSPLFEPQALQVIYFDVYGTLIDRESGIFDALDPLLARSSHCLDRHETLSFYFEVEDGVKRRIPTAPYSGILSQAHQEMALRLGLTAPAEESTTFASTLINWPLFDGALQCLQALRSLGLMVVALADIDLETLCKTSAFQTLLQHYLSEIWSWEGVHVYRPHPNTLGQALLYHDHMGIPRERRCLISDALFERLELGCQLAVPAVWIRNPVGLAGNLPSADGSFVWKIVPDLSRLVSAIVEGKTATQIEPSATLIEHT
ncbi:hypothetical protein B0H16DRAFT_750723 [Mycena metata]|uniref:Uncharacterized protein n=1 Tax=Mycena metata TaxID=1033252 RepID=A0AAD7DYT7_9AGAR|nr:hypothetical protein B0H16DRAFT_750723 [Mycena metata]